ncbi:MAG: FAD-dependent oxidoreductase [Thermodesulfobacteriota bacterium]
MGFSEEERRWWGWGLNEAPTPAAKGLYAFLAGRLGGPPSPGPAVPRLEEVKLRASELSPDLEAELIKAVGPEHVRRGLRTRLLHTLGRGYRDLIRLRLGRLPAPPDAVVYPDSHRQVRAVLEAAARHHAAVVPFGGGSSVVGGLELDPDLRPFLSLDLTRLNRVLAIDRSSLTARVQAGIFGPDLEKALSAEGLTLGHFPQSFEFSTLGGWIAARGAGHKSNRYGKIEDLVLSLRAALPGGDLETPMVPASAVGGDPGPLLAGSEGTLGVITEAVVKVRPQPAVESFEAYLFPNFESGLEAVREMLAQGVVPATTRLSDQEETVALMAEASTGRAGLWNRFLLESLAPRYLGWRGIRMDRSSLFLMIDEGSPAEVDRRRRAAAGILKRHRGVRAGAGPARAWHETRYAAPYLRDEMITRGWLVETLETAATWKRLPVLYESVRAALRKALGGVVVLTHLSHAYSAGANLYFTFFAHQEPGGEEEQWRRAKEEATRAIVENQGALSHHHGVGRDHKPWFEKYWGRELAGLFKSAKARLDPLAVLNPGAVFEPEPEFPGLAEKHRPFSPGLRAANLGRFQAELFDVLVVGGGIVGAGTAWDATLRGLSTALVEKDDFAAGTSGKSSRMIHGGLRYLKMMDLKLVRESLGERHHLLGMAPHLVRPAPHLVPIYKGEGDSRTVMHLGLWGYEALAGSKGLPAHRSLSAAEVLEIEPTLRENGLEGGLVYYDALTDDARLTLETVKAAARAGAVPANHVQVIRLAPGPQEVRADLRDNLTGREFAARARTVVNAAGVWSDRVRSAADPGAESRVRPSKGIHITFPRALKPINHVVILKGADGRPLFAVPAGPVVYVGTTDTDYDGDLDGPRAETEEVDYLIEAVNGSLAGPPLARDQVTASWAGIRPLVASDAKDETKDLSREHEIWVEHDRLVTVRGGKLTTFRIMAAQTVDRVLEILTGATQPPSPTAGLALCGPGQVVTQEGTGFPESVTVRLERKYGPQARTILDLARSPVLAAVLDPEVGLTAAEVYWAVEGEMALTLTDAMVRRLGLMYMTPDNGLALCRRVARIMAPLLSWKEEETRAQVEAYMAYVDRERSFRGRAA